MDHQPTAGPRRRWTRWRKQIHVGRYRCIEQICVPLRAMPSTDVTLSSSRIRLRRWRDGDREAFAAMNSDARVMAFFAGQLKRAESDAMVDRIQKHFSEHGFGLWAVEVPGVAPFIGFAGLAWAKVQCPFHARRGSRLAAGLRSLGARLCDRGGSIGAGPRVWAARAVGCCIVHVGDQPPITRRHRAAWHAPRSCRGFDYPSFPEGHPLRRHVLYRLSAEFISLKALHTTGRAPACAPSIVRLRPARRRG